MAARLWTTIRQNWYLGFTSFGGPPVHFKIFRDKFVKKLEWIDEQVYQELFSVCQAFSGPGSTKMHYCITLHHLGFLPAVLGFLIWSLPGAIGMYALALGISNIDESLPRAVYALLSGLNAATVGIVALAAVQLSEKAITDPLTRILVFLGAAAGMMYNALWYFPLLMLLAGLAAVIHDLRWLHGPVKSVVGFSKRVGRVLRREKEAVEERHRQGERVELEDALGGASQGASSSTPAVAGKSDPVSSVDNGSRNDNPETEPERRVVPPARRFDMGWKTGLLIIVLFLVSFAAIMALRGALPSPMPRLFALFANMYLAGTIIFGGGPVVIPLLREYIVAENWVSARDFLLGLAIIQAFPGPNFNFAVYLGALTAINAGQHSLAGAVLGFVGMFFPGLVTVHGTMGVWAAIRGRRWVKSALRGLNASAVGLIYTAVYRLWQIGYIDEGYEQGTSLALEPWWVVITATSYVCGYWFKVSPPVAIVMGGVMGMIWYGVVSTT
ncbi:related to chromate transport protein [Cephalotrichum gorgonifer]|uniref:Related to chromate transport protein n=1 Tax=Cephalotrichum gorgonifer TaxID=2041049 RepID=A0AAE8SXC0_9PEZI|nr:related to chromate transport protein [Cephalotrichum gorgonifer]